MDWDNILRIKADQLDVEISEMKELLKKEK